MFYNGIYKSTDNPVYICGYANKNCFYYIRNKKFIREEVSSAVYDLRAVPKHQNPYWVQ